ncbi:MAG TPA: amidohydrolase family protein [Thermoanaerobaculia bacterium]
MKKLLLLLLLPVLPAPSSPQAPRPLVFTHVTVIDMTGAPPSPDMTVVIAGDRITELGKSKAVRAPEGAQVVDATGKFMIPGLWDMHVHWFNKDYLPLFIANGVTGIRMMWGMPLHHQWRREIEQGALLGPRMSIASAIVDGPKPIWPGSIAVGTDAEGRQAVIKSKQEGADFIKVYSRLPREAYFAIADEAKKQGIPFAGHVPETVSVIEASDAGQKSIEHFTSFMEACSTREEELRKARADAWANLPEGQARPSRASLRPLSRQMLDTFSPEKANALFARLARNHTWQCPTLVVQRNMAFIKDPAIHDDPRVKYMPPGIASGWDPTGDFRLQDRTQEDYDLARAAYKKLTELVVPMRRAGVEFLAGTDVINPYCFPGFSLHDELTLLVQAGLSPMEALQAATLNPARFLDKEKDLGTVAKGKIADLVVLEANPLADIGNSRKIDAVVLNGKLFPKPELQKMLADVEALAGKK